MIEKVRSLLLLACSAITLLGCATHTVKSTEVPQIVSDSRSIPEDMLLDVGVSIFDPGIDEIHGDDEETFNDDIRVAESRYAPYLLAETLQRSANWGIVRVMPNDNSPMDVMLKGTILRSNGEIMVIRIEALDSRGRAWFEKDYEQQISQFSYERQNLQRNDPFQPIYNNIANDLFAYMRRNIDPLETQQIRSTSEILFAESFSPDAFGSYLKRDDEEGVEIISLPAANDPLLERIRNIRERDFMFIDAVQDYYATYVRQMRNPYDSWRGQSYEAAMELKEVEAAARRRFIAGAAAIVGGIAAANGGNYAAQIGGATAVGAGALLIREGFNKRNEVADNIQAIEEINQTLENVVAPQVLDLDDRTITLNGSVEEQYAQWREILADLYRSEVGEFE